MKVIINGDDFGRSREFNQGIARSFLEGKINRTTVMVNMPYFEEAAELSKEYDFFGNVGLHLNFAEGRALSDICRKSELCDEDGNFKGEFYKSIKGRFFLGSDINKAIKAECEAQVKRYIEHGFPLMHADSHNYTHTYWSVLKNVRPVLKKYGFKSVRISHNIPPENIPLFFKVYKFIVNNFLLNWKVNGVKVKKTRYFGSLEDYLRFSKTGEIKGNVEIMVHPYLNKNGGLDDVEIEGVKPMPEKEWLNKNGLIF